MRTGRGQEGLVTSKIAFANKGFFRTTDQIFDKGLEWFVSLVF